MQWVLAKSGVQTVTGFHFILDVHQKPGNRRIGVPLADDIEGLQQRHTRLHHRRQLSGEERDVLVADLAAHSHPLTSDLENSDALAAEHRIDHCIAAGAHLAFYQPAGFVLAFPEVGVFLDPVAYCPRCRGHSVTSSRFIRW